jgi:hypothetical protein
MSVVDQDGAMKVFALSTKGEWGLQGCYHFSGEDSKYDYFAYSSQLTKQKSEPIDTCKSDVRLQWFQR